MPNPGRTLLLALTVLVVACSSGAPPAGTIPTVEEAHGFLDQVVELAQAGDFDGLCAIGDGNCMDHLEDAGRDAVPPDPPTVVRTGTVPTTSSGDQTSLGGIVLVLCGIDGHGDHYDSEMLVFHDGTRAPCDQPRLLGKDEDRRQPHDGRDVRTSDC